MELSVVIVNFNVRHFLEQCLYSVIRAAAGRQVEIFVVDNHSSDGSMEYLQPLFPSVQFIANAVNEGFSRANNRTIPLLKGEFVLFLNPDTILPEDCFEKCFDFFRSKEDAGALGVRMIDGAGNFLPESKRRLPSLVSSALRLAGLDRHKLLGKTMPSYYEHSLTEFEEGPVQILSGAFMLMRRTLLYELGGFDADYFMYGEDIDISYRIGQLGYCNYYLGSCSIIHFKGESSVRHSPAFIRQFYGAMILFVKKHFSGLKSAISLAAINFARFLSIMLAGLMPAERSRSYQRERAIKISGTADDVSRALTMLKRSGVPFVEATHDMAFDTLLIHVPHTSYKKLISIFSENAGLYEFWVSASDSRSIIGSRSSQEKGLVIS